MGVPAPMFPCAPRHPSSCAWGLQSGDPRVVVAAGDVDADAIATSPRLPFAVSSVFLLLLAL